MEREEKNLVDDGNMSSAISELGFDGYHLFIKRQKAKIIIG